MQQPSRRSFLSAAGLGAAAAALAACSGGGPGPRAGATATGAAGAKASLPPQKGKATFAFWGGSDGETKGFQHLKEKFEAANPGAEVHQGGAVRRLLRRHRPRPAGRQRPRRLPRRLHDDRQVQARRARCST
ncbi:hypothetical protein GCM10025868_10980 [Angustibacter aerolatus]|uniref:Uncharacterized protein n=1 Tax=Angustibacter aerolatus TaxID=1162965 RepID=A0ABQ6JEJ4_9ACTN|nr:hypothetical protein GCM10025868_10980 [Angustibacter aerolatus]